MTIKLEQLQDIAKNYELELADLKIEINGKFSLYLRDEKENIWYERHSY